jgi:hypothetical protein
VNENATSGLKNPNDHEILAIGGFVVAVAHTKAHRVTRAEAEVKKMSLLWPGA